VNEAEIFGCFFRIEQTHLQFCCSTSLLEEPNSLISTCAQRAYFNQQFRPILLICEFFKCGKIMLSPIILGIFESKYPVPVA